MSNPEQNDGITTILRANGYDPHQVVKTESGIRTAFEHLESFIMAAFDELDECNEEETL